VSALPPEPAYLALHRRGELAERARSAREALRSCELCAHRCGVDRLTRPSEAPRGAVCRTGARARVASYGPHQGEEGPLRGSRGSGTIFFSWCNLRCVYCQNWEISHAGEGRDVEADELAETMLSLQRRGCHNVNLVSPSHVVAPVLEALVIAAERGLRVPIVYNTGGYDALETLALLDGVVDIYMPDMKYGDDEVARRASAARDYVAVNRAAVREMHRQVGDLALDAKGVARRGLLVRHLVLPDELAGTASVLRFLAEEISKATYVNVMGQYRPCYRADEHPDFARSPTPDEMREAFSTARRLGLERTDR
jgi:putative pyruvate formate lyase activating enzyme